MSYKDVTDKTTFAGVSGALGQINAAYVAAVIQAVYGQSAAVVKIALDKAKTDEERFELTRLHNEFSALEHGARSVAESTSDALNHIPIYDETEQA